MGSLDENLLSVKDVKSLDYVLKDRELSFDDVLTLAYYYYVNSRSDLVRLRVSEYILKVYSDRQRLWVDLDRLLNDSRLAKANYLLRMLCELPTYSTISQFMRESPEWKPILESRLKNAETYPTRSVLITLLKHSESLSNIERRVELRNKLKNIIRPAYLGYFSEVLGERVFRRAVSFLMKHKYHEFRVYYENYLSESVRVKIVHLYGRNPFGGYTLLDKFINEPSNEQVRFLQDLLMYNGSLDMYGYELMTNDDILQGIAVYLDNPGNSEYASLLKSLLMKVVDPISLKYYVSSVAPQYEEYLVDFLIKHPRLLVEYYDYMDEDLKMDYGNYLESAGLTWDEILESEPESLDSSEVDFKMGAETVVPDVVDEVHDSSDDEELESIEEFEEVSEPAEKYVLRNDESTLNTPNVSSEDIIVNESEVDIAEENTVVENASSEVSVEPEVSAEDVGSEQVEVPLEPEDVKPASTGESESSVAQPEENVVPKSSEGVSLTDDESELAPESKEIESPSLEESSRVEVSIEEGNPEEYSEVVPLKELLESEEQGNTEDLAYAKTMIGESPLVRPRNRSLRDTVEEDWTLLFRPLEESSNSREDSEEEVIELDGDELEIIEEHPLDGEDTSDLVDGESASDLFADNISEDVVEEDLSDTPEPEESNDLESVSGEIHQDTLNSTSDSDEGVIKGPGGKMILVNALRGVAGESSSFDPKTVRLELGLNTDQGNTLGLLEKAGSAYDAQMYAYALFKKDLIITDDGIQNRINKSPTKLSFSTLMEDLTVHPSASVTLISMKYGVSDKLTEKLAYLRALMKNMVSDLFVDNPNSQRFTSYLADFMIWYSVFSNSYRILNGDVFSKASLVKFTALLNKGKWGIGSQVYESGLHLGKIYDYSDEIIEILRSVEYESRHLFELDTFGLTRDVALEPSLYRLQRLADDGVKLDREEQSMLMDSKPKADTVVPDTVALDMMYWWNRWTDVYSKEMPFSDSDLLSDRVFRNTVSLEKLASRVHSYSKIENKRFAELKSTVRAKTTYEDLESKGLIGISCGSDNSSIVRKVLSWFKSSKADDELPSSKATMKVDPIDIDKLAVISRDLSRKIREASKNRNKWKLR